MTRQTREEYLAKKRKYYQEHKDYFRDYWRQHKAQRHVNNKKSRIKQRAANIDKWREEAKVLARGYRARLKAEVLGHYSKGEPTCSMCGEKRRACLTIDHINGGGRKHRLSLNLPAGSNFYLWLKTNKYPNGYQVLCMNCHLSKDNP